MPTFRNLSDAAKHYSNGSSWGGNVPKAQLMLIMKREAKRLEDILYEEIHNYYFSYIPVKYNRTWNLLHSTRMSEPIVENGMITVKVYFDHDMAYHPSLFNSNDDGYVPYLLSHGYSWRNPRGNNDHFSNYTGSHFISKTINRYSAENPYGIQIQAFFNGEPYVE